MAKKQIDMSKTYIIIAAILGLAILGYGFMNYSAKMKVLEADKQAKEIEVKKENDKELSLRICLLNASSNTNDFWNKECKSYGINHKKDDCNLPEYNAKNVNDYKKNEQEKCYQLYK